MNPFPSYEPKNLLITSRIQSECIEQIPMLNKCFSYFAVIPEDLNGPKRKEMAKIPLLKKHSTTLSI